jgi:tRNA modification GTPase
MISNGDTIAALATPAGTSALAIVRASGPGCAGIARDALRPALGKSVALAASAAPRALAPRVATHADYYALRAAPEALAPLASTPRQREGVLLDGVVATFFAGPNSSTGEDVLEVCCHGNPFVAQKILEDFIARGCRAAEPGEFTRRAFLNGRIDLAQAEAVMDLIHARSERALAAANQQLRGSLGRHMDTLTGELLDTLARVEAYIDFPDEDLPAEDRGIVRRAIDALTRGTARLLATRHYGELLREGIRTVIIGEPNAGKSSLLNRLVGHERALVSPEPGTTRDFIEERIHIGPHCLRLIDTAGLNPSPAPLEKRGIEKTFERAAEADLFLLVIDATQGSPSLPQNLPPEILKRMTAANTIIILNKIDLLLETTASEKSQVPKKSQVPNPKTTRIARKFFELRGFLIRSSFVIRHSDFGFLSRLNKFVKIRVIRGFFFFALRLCVK